MQQLVSIKSIIKVTGPKPDKLKHVKFFSVISLAAIAVFGVIVECFDDYKKRRSRIFSENGDDDNPLNGGGSTNPVEKDDG